MSLNDKIFRILVPTEAEQQTREKANGQKVKVEVKRKVFPGYVLIEMILDDSTWYLIKSTTGVTGFVSSGNKPIPIQPREIADILEAEEGLAPVPVIRFEKNEIVRVASGPFTEFTGKIEEVNQDKEKLKVLISIFGRDTPVELDFAQVEKID